MVTSTEAQDGEARQSPAPETLRRRRSNGGRSRSIRLLRVTRREALLAAERATELEAGMERPHKREECKEAPRPCPHVSCRHHLYLDVNPHTGTIKLNFPDLEVWELGVSCALDVADMGGTAIEQVSELLNVTRERIRQIETQALQKLSSIDDTEALRDFHE
jgi:hypothetical protein